MSYQPYDRNPSGIVFFGTNPTDQVFESNANFTIDGTSLVATNLKISNGGNIGSASDADAISIAANGDVTMSQDLTITGDLTVNGATTTVSTTNTIVSDLLLELGNGTTGTPANDAGIVIERGDQDNAFIGFDESANKFTMGTGSFTGASTGDLTIAAGTLVANLEGNVTGDVTGNADTATTLATGRNFSLTGEVTAANVSFNGSSAVALAATLDKTAITNQTAITEIADGDLVLVADASDSNNLKKITKSNFVSALGGGTMSSFNITDGSTSQQIDNGEDITFADGTGAEFVVSATNTITVNTVDGEIVHDDLSGFVANEHIDHSSVSISAGTGLSGGGTIASTRTLSVDINGTSDLASPAVADELLISDADDSNTVKKADVASIVNLADHDALTNFVANEHINHTAVSITAGAGLSGGGDISSTRTLAVDINGSSDLAAPAVGDELLISDITDSNNIKKADVASVVNLADHDALTNFVANEHIDHSSVTMTAGAGLTGGGTIASTRTFAVGAGTGITVNANDVQISDGGVDTDQLAADAVTGAKIADDSIDSEHYVDGSIDTAHIGNLQVTTAKIAADAIDGTKLADNAVNSEHYTDGSIDTAHIANDQITNALMADDAIDSPQIADGAVDEVHRTRTVATPSTSVTLSSDINLCTGTITVTMPTGASGKMVTVKNVGTGVVTIAATPNIDGSSGDHILYHQNEVATLVYGNSQWNII